MERINKSFRFTQKTVNSLKVLTNETMLSETLVLEIAIELMAQTPNKMNLINDDKFFELCYKQPALLRIPENINRFTRITETHKAAAMKALKNYSLDDE